MIVVDSESSWCRDTRMNAYHNLVYFLISVTPLLISTWAFLVYWSEYLASFLEPDPATLRPDYIIVGGGAAGAVLAARLSEDPAVAVVVVEAGGAPAWLTGVPVLTPSLQLGGYDWKQGPSLNTVSIIAVIAIA